jgi:hypothetical protein
MRHRACVRVYLQGLAFAAFPQTALLLPQAYIGDKVYPRLRRALVRVQR